MIKSIQVQNFQRIDDPVSIDFGAVTVLVGENGSGKSSFLKAVHWAVRCATLSDGSGKVALEQMDFVPSKDFLDLSHKLKLQNNSNGRKIVVSLTDDSDRETSIVISAARNNAGVLVNTDGPLKKELLDNEKPSTAYIPGIAGAAEEETILAVPIMHRKASSGEGGSILRQIILAHGVSSEGTGQNYVELTELSKWVSLVLPDTRFWVKFDRLRDRHIDVKFLTPEMRVPGQSHSVAWKSIDMAGTGFLQVVQIFAYLLYFEPKLLLIDEPDAHLHPRRQQLLIKALEKAALEFPQTQIVLSTHSPSLVRALSSEAKLHWIDNGTAKAEGDVVRARMGWSTLDKELLIFSEDGNTEALQRVLDQWPSLAQKCAIWPTFGKDSLPNGSKAISLMKKMAIKVLIHRDRDFMSDSDVAAWREKKEYILKSIPVWIPDGSDVESLFCDTLHIASVMQVSEHIACEILSDALSHYDKDEWMHLFSMSYSDAVNKLEKNSIRNPILRWNDLGEYNSNTIKGKKLIELIEGSCVPVLKRHGLESSIGLRNNLRRPTAAYPLGENLKKKIELVLEK
ncbi:AAA family ATPase [Brucella inopinata]|uniref:AAA family ATPase n=1 Tax=Brucella inopinata TaxID=1218315 RepID=UPI000870E828|nr:ATP-binding protein [Brucella inopinata]SCD22741.1 hypothetical protein BR141012304_10299 [Brucella inopinata]